MLLSFKVWQLVMVMGFTGEMRDEGEGWWNLAMQPQRPKGDSAKVLLMRVLHTAELNV